MIIEDKTNIPKLIKENDVEKISSAIGVNSRTVWAWKKGDRTPSDENFRRLKGYYNGKRHLCLWCEEPFVPDNAAQEICSEKCAEEYNNWESENRKESNVESVEPDEKESEIISLYKNAKSAKDVAEDVEIPYWRVKEIINEKGDGIEGWEMPKREKECKRCGKVFIGAPNKVYCSEKCQRMANIDPSYFEVFYRDHFRCRYCGKTPADGVTLTIDHVYPHSRGGGNQRVNLVTACKSCNSHKRDTMWPEERIKEIWWQNRKLQEGLEKKSFEEMLDEFESEYPEQNFPSPQPER